MGYKLDGCEIRKDVSADRTMGIGLRCQHVTHTTLKGSLALIYDKCSGIWTHFHPLTAFLPLSGAKIPLLSLVLEDGWAVYWLPQVSGEEESVKFKYAGILLHNLVLSSGNLLLPFL